METRGYLVVTDTVAADGKTDVADQIQKLIDENPNRTIYFPDGVYVLGHPILTLKSVDLQLSNYAVLKAADGWSSEEAMVRLGGECPANDIRTIGSNYSFTGGIVDGNGVANGLSIDGGRETKIRDVSIKHTRIGIHINRGANSGSSDSDVMSVNIVGNRARNSIGVLLEGYDNTLSNMRIADVYVGIEVRSSGNSFRNLHPLYTCGWDDYGDSTGFWDRNGNNWYSFCYSDQFAIGFHLGASICSIFDSCYCFWYAGKAPWEKGVKADGMFNSVMNTFRADFHRDSVKNVFLEVAEPGGHGVLNHPVVNRQRVSDFAFESYIS